MKKGFARAGDDFVTICMICKKVKVEGELENWSPVELNLEERMDIQLSHGLCPPCYVETIVELETQVVQLDEAG